MFPLGGSRLPKINVTYLLYVTFYTIVKYFIVFGCDFPANVQRAALYHRRDRTRVQRNVFIGRATYSFWPKTVVKWLVGRRIFEFHNVLCSFEQCTRQMRVERMSRECVYHFLGIARFRSIFVKLSDLKTVRFPVENFIGSSRSVLDFSWRIEVGRYLAYFGVFCEYLAKPTG